MLDKFDSVFQWPSNTNVHGLAVFIRGLSDAAELLAQELETSDRRCSAASCEIFLICIPRFENTERRLTTNRQKCPGP